MHESTFMKKFTIVGTHENCTRILPPFDSPSPSLGLAYLTAFLKNLANEVKQFDFSQEFIDKKST